MLEADFIRTARAKRLPARTVYLGHALPNALTASLTLGGLILSALVAGTVLVENVFAWPGLGSTIVSSILNKDYQVVQAIVLVYGVGVLLVNTVVDVGARAARPALDDQGGLRRAALDERAPHAARPDRDRADGRACWCSRSWPRSCGPTRRTPSTPATSWPGRRAEHWAGTDNLGRDIFYRVLVATRLSVELALAATAIAVVVGLLLGTAPFAPRPPQPAGW